MQTLNIHDQQLTELAYSVQNIINNSLAVLELKVDESKEEVMPYVPPAERQHVADHFAEMKQEQKLIHSAFNTLVNLVREGNLGGNSANEMADKFAPDQAQGKLYIRQPEDILLDHLRNKQKLEHHEA
jgi:hypothetical protein